MSSDSLTQADTSEGNIISSLVLDETPQTFRGRSWFLTWNSYKECDTDTLTQYLENYAVKYAIQEETGESGTPHLQGMFILKNATSAKALWKKFPKVYIRKLIDEKSAVAYCTKTATRTGRQWLKGYCKPVTDPLAGKELKDWQIEVLEYIKEEPDDREIRWYFDTCGGVGKTALAKHICLKYSDALYCSGKAADVKYAITQMKEKGLDPNIIIFDIPRCSRDYISYQAIEELKNGIFFSGKYESGMVMFNNPHVICFANEEPKMDKLSIDRWYIKEVM